MTNEEMYRTLKHSFKSIIEMYSIPHKTVSVRAPGFDPLKPDTQEITLVGDFDGNTGECSTTYVRAAATFEGTLDDVLNLDIENDPYARGIYIAAVNAVMNKYHMADDCVTCSSNSEADCAEYVMHYYKKNNGKPNLLLVGYQETMLELLAQHFPVKVLDLDPDNIGKTFFGVTVEHGVNDYDDSVKWADVILCTGSVISNGTIIKYLNLPKDVIFYGTTIAGFGRVFSLKRLCPYSRN